MITTIKINKELKVQKCEHNGIKIFISLKKEHKIITIKLTEYEIELLEFIFKIICEQK